MHPQWCPASTKAFKVRKKWNVLKLKRSGVSQVFWRPKRIFFPEKMKLAAEKQKKNTSIWKANKTDSRLCLEKKMSEINISHFLFHLSRAQTSVCWVFPRCFSNRREKNSYRDFLNKLKGDLTFGLKVEQVLKQASHFFWWNDPDFEPVLF